MACAGVLDLIRRGRRRLRNASLVDFDPGNPAADEPVVAYDLTKTDPRTVAALRERAVGRVLFERATCWTDSPHVAADITGLLCQAVLAPWDAKPRPLDDGTIREDPVDDRPAENVAADLARTAPEQEDGDGGTPPDPDGNLRLFAEAVTADGARERDGAWLAGVREYVPDAGPVPSSRFL